MEMYNKYLLLVIEELKSDPYFYKPDNLIIFEVPRDGEKLDVKTHTGKVVAVWDLETLGGIKIHNKGEEKISSTTFAYEFQILINHSAFDGIRKKCIKQVTGKSLGDYESQSEIKQHASALLKKLNLSISVDELLKLIPKNKKYRFMRRIAEKFIKEPRIDNWKLASCIYPTLQNQTVIRKKFTKKDFINNKAKYDKKIKSRIKSINKIWRPQGREIKFHWNFCELTTVK